MVRAFYFYLISVGVAHHKFKFHLMDPNSKDPNSKKEDKKDVKVETRVVITSKIENNKTMKQKLCNA